MPRVSVIKRGVLQIYKARALRRPAALRLHREGRGGYITFAPPLRVHLRPTTREAATPSSRSRARSIFGKLVGDGALSGRQLARPRRRCPAPRARSILRKLVGDDAPGWCVPLGLSSPLRLHSSPPLPLLSDPPRFGVRPLGFYEETRVGILHWRV